MACPMEPTEAFCDYHVSAFSFLGNVPRNILYDNTRLAAIRSWDPPREYFHPPLTSRQFRPKKRVHLRVTAARTA